MADGSATNPRALVVLGMHRSGTSALARCCSLLGGDLGDDLLPPRADNEAGFWEDPVVVAENDVALLALNLVWSDVWPIDPAGWRDPALLRARAALVDVARDRLARSDLWVVKDPRIARLVPLWTGIFDELGVEAAYLIALRHPAEIADSLARRDRLSRAHCHLLWLRYALESELHTRGRRRAFVRYDDLLSDWRHALAKAASDVALAWPVELDAAAPRIEPFLRAGLRHEVADDAAFAVDPTVSDWVRRTATALEDAAAGDAERAGAELDRVRAELAAGDRVATAVAREIQADVFALREIVDRPSHPIRYAHQRIAILEAELAEAKRTAGDVVRAAEDAAAASAERAGRAEADLQTARETIGVVARRESELRGMLDEILQSRSWRLTGVLREVARRLRRLGARAGATDGSPSALPGAGSADRPPARGRV
ncbi:MAG TPA: hypothetical protein VFD92_14045 [Candidatus Binatia bacterium]|nr:hypothetical protein [Candidatus Binatia bacterium]